eukprot:TRINITY_DN339_c0_g2_i1.p1 TRINITY_DN339_c0_g2~~TRINITY_DN339_c0_g2_i1.p1  ORF type:complete len:465 (+),score=174.76 TRINITY_DN339_c0_g2_i1:237-1631(+)
MEVLTDEEKCIVKAQTYWNAGDHTQAKKWLLKSININPTAKAQRLLDKLNNEISSSSASASSSSSSTCPPPSSSPSFSSATTQESSSTSRSSSSSSSSIPRSRSAAPSSSSTSTTTQTQTQTQTQKSKTPPIWIKGVKGEYTQEQQEAAIRIKSLNNFYDILGIKKSCTEQEVRTAYRKLALLFHPDKNHAPDASTAFHAVSAAYHCLSDSKRRQYYDMKGEDNEQTQSRQAEEQAQQHQQYYEQYQQEQDLSPDDIFNMFFGIPPSGRMRRRRYYYTEAATTHDNNTNNGAAANGDASGWRGFATQFVHFLPLIALFLLSFLSFSTHEEQMFSLEKNQFYTVKRVFEADLKGYQPIVPSSPSSSTPSPSTTTSTPSPSSSSSSSPSYTYIYFVTRSFDRQYGRDYRAITQVEDAVRHAYYRRHEAACQNERMQQRRRRETPPSPANSECEKMRRIEFDTRASR